MITTHVDFATKPNSESEYLAPEIVQCRNLVRIFKNELIWNAKVMEMLRKREFYVYIGDIWVRYSLCRCQRVSKSFPLSWQPQPHMYIYQDKFQQRCFNPNFVHECRRGIVNGIFYLKKKKSYMVMWLKPIFLRLNYRFYNILSFRALTNKRIGRWSTHGQYVKNKLFELYKFILKYSAIIRHRSREWPKNS